MVNNKNVKSYLTAIQKANSGYPKQTSLGKNTQTWPLLWMLCIPGRDPPLPRISRLSVWKASGAIWEGCGREEEFLRRKSITGLEPWGFITPPYFLRTLCGYNVTKHLILAEAPSHQDKLYPSQNVRVNKPIPSFFWSAVLVIVMRKRNN